MPPGIMDIKGIMQKLPHRYPFQMVDRIVEVEPLKYIRAYKNVTNNEPYFVGHFPGEPIMPGVMQVEALAQAGGILLHYSYDLTEGQVILLRGFDDMKLRRTVAPGDRLDLYAEIVTIHRGLCRMKVRASVDDRTTVTGVMSCFFEVPVGGVEVLADGKTIVKGDGR
jgi:3-hydroxyacyl-[acyl-carrier-protein] dehydratase